MKKQITTLFSLVLLFQNVMAQDVSRGNNHRNFPVIVTLQMQSLALPFKQMNGNFKNVGIGIGTEISHGGGDNGWVQGFHVLWYKNKTVGNGVMTYTQTEWRPAITQQFHAGLKAGIGYAYVFRPVESYKQTNGNWVKVGKRGVGMLAVPVGVSFEYNNYTHAGSYFAPFLGYQLMLLKGYNQSIPLIPTTFVQSGTRIHIK